RNRPTMEKIQALQGEQSKEYALYTTLLQEKLTGRPQAPRAQADSPPKKVAGASSDERREGRVDATGVKESAQTFAQPPPAVVTVKEDGVIPPDVLLDPFGHDGEDQAPGTKGLESWTLSLVSRSPFKNPDTETSRNFRGTIDTSGSASIRVDDKGNLSGSGYLSGQFSYQGEFLNDKGLWEFHSDGLSSAGPFSVTGKRDGNDLIFSFEGTIPFGDGGGWDAESFSGWNTAIERKEGATSKRHTGQLAWHVGPGVGLIDFTTTFTLSGGRNVVPFEVAETKLPADRRPPWKLKLDSECQYAGGGWSKTEGHVDFWLPKQGNRVYAEGSMHTTVNFMGTVSEMSELLIIDGIVQDCMLISKPRHATQSFEMEGQVLQMAADYGRGILYEQDMGEVQIVLTNGAVFVQEDQVPGAAAKTVWTLTGPDKVDPELFENELRDPGCPERFRTDVEYTINADLASSELNVGVKIYFDKGIIVATPEVTRRMVPSLRAGRAYNVEALHAEEGTYEFVTVTDQQLSELKGKWEREIEKRWNDQYRIQCGDKAERKPFTPRFDAQFVNNREDANYHVTVWPGYERANVLNWYAEQRDATAPHEFGHMINLSDEYKMLSECPGRQVFNDDTLMGSGNTVKSRHFKQLADWLRSHTGCDCMVVEQEKEKLHADKK
ncbi:MAG: hypothetical protein KKC51_03500, partial [Verrucomicrobia bacterium]|nr:hypothetical protein [Verrucomicrobiota bacterium]